MPLGEAPMGMTHAAYAAHEHRPLLSDSSRLTKNGGDTLELSAPAKVMRETHGPRAANAPRWGSAKLKLVDAHFPITASTPRDGSEATNAVWSERWPKEPEASIPLTGFPADFSARRP